MATLSNICCLPSRTRVAATRSFGQEGLRSAAKSMSRESASRSGSKSKGSKWPERRVGPNATELPAGEKPPTSISERNEVSLVMRCQKLASSLRAPSRPPFTSPQARSVALIAPTLAPLMLSNAQVGSSRSRSSTPQVKAPKAPPPCSASDNFCGGQVGGGGRGALTLAFASTAAACFSSARAVSTSIDASEVSGGEFSAGSPSDATSAAGPSGVRFPCSRLKKRASARTSDGRNRFRKPGSSGDLVSASRVAGGSSAAAAVSAVALASAHGATASMRGATTLSVDQISAAESSAVAAVRSKVAASRAAPFCSTPSPAPDETFSFISGIPEMRNYPAANMAATKTFFQLRNSVPNRYRWIDTPVSQPRNVGDSRPVVLRSLPDFAFGARQQPFDVFAVRVEQKESEHGKQHGERRVLEPPQEQRRNHACRQRRQRGVAEREGEREPDRAEQDRRRPDQTDQDADIDGNALAALEFEPDREDVAEESPEACQHRRVRSAEIAGNDHGDRALERVEHQRRGGEPLAPRAQHVGRADIAGTDRAQVSRPGKPGEDEPERDRAKEITDDQGQRIGDFRSHVSGSQEALHVF